jgi:hypothetical protein
MSSVWGQLQKECRMASNDQNIRVTIDNSEFLEAVQLMLARRESAPPAERQEIDRALERLNAGGGAGDRLRVYWHETTREGDTVVHITAGPALLELALPASADAGVARPTRRDSDDRG